MKVSELIDLLEEMDPDAEVILQEQAGYPMEYALGGVTTRDEVLRAEAEERDDGREDAHGLEGGRARNDVFLVEGEHLRYGSKTAWDVATR
jgi:hypothetical protein